MFVFSHTNYINFCTNPDFLSVFHDQREQANTGSPYQLVNPISWRAENINIPFVFSFWWGQYNAMALKAQVLNPTLPVATKSFSLKNGHAITSKLL